MEKDPPETKDAKIDPPETKDAKIDPPETKKDAKTPPETKKDAKSPPEPPKEAEEARAKDKTDPTTKLAEKIEDLTIDRPRFTSKAEQRANVRTACSLPTSQERRTAILSTSVLNHENTIVVRRETYLAAAKQSGEERRLSLRSDQPEEPEEKKEEEGDGVSWSQRDVAMREGPRELGNYSTDVAAVVSKLGEYYNGMQSQEESEILPSVVAVRKLLSLESNPPISAVIESGCVPRLVELLSHKVSNIQFESAWCLTNIASGTSDQCKVVIEAGTVAIFVQLMSSDSVELQEQAIWGLGNIAGDNTKARDFVLTHNIMPRLIELVGASDKLSLLRNAVWLASNLCRGKPSPRWNLVAPLIPILCKTINHADVEVITDSCWALSYLSDGPNDRIQAVINGGPVKRMVELLLHQNPQVVVPALRSLGNIVTGDDLQTQAAIDCGFVPSMMHLLESPKRSIRKEACWALSNISAGNVQQIQVLVDANAFPVLLLRLQEDDFDVKKEAAWAVSNATSGGSPEQIHYLTQIGALAPLVAIMDAADARIVRVALEGVENILRVGENKQVANDGVNPYLELLEACGGLDALEKMQLHEDHDIYDAARKILEQFGLAEEEDDQDVMM